MAVRTRSKYTSKGKFPTMSRALKKAVRRERSVIEKHTNIVNAWAKNRNTTMITIENPNKNETNKRFIRVPANQYFGYYKQPRNKVSIKEIEDAS